MRNVSVKDRQQRCREDDEPHSYGQRLGQEVNRVFEEKAIRYVCFTVSTNFVICTIGGVQ